MRKKLHPDISDYDVSKFSALSDDGFVSMLCGESARVNTLKEVASKRFEKYQGKINHLSLALAQAKKAKGNLARELVDSIALGKELRDSHNRRSLHDLNFLSLRRQNLLEMHSS
ncbi:UNVERIFIED_CONTAM: hypothetical protein Slati_1468600 [Sesamum latifolium]|uniref:Uncharacterized protein n=1 Tax=Sesamum latifolium TaxID=2727402 RepID=A0AAW2X530_9LAMI